MTSRKHYNAVASIIATEIRNAQSMVDLQVMQARIDTAQRIGKLLADEYKADNTAFDRYRFLDACNIVN